MSRVHIKMAKRKPYIGIIERKTKLPSFTPTPN